jgi:methanogenic corrinoid protein MtbC1
LTTSDRGENTATASDPQSADYGSIYPSDPFESAANARRSPFDGHLHELAGTIENVIIPRLRVNLGVSGLPAREAVISEIGIGTEIVESFAKLVMSHDNREAFRFVERLFEWNISLESILLDLMVPAARYMDHLWVSDSCSFVDVTLGMTRIQQILRQCRQFDVGITTKSTIRGHILLVPVPGEQHTFGLRVIEEMLMRDGWEVTSNLRASVDDIIQMVSDSPYQVIGLSISGERLLEPLHSIIKLIRHHSLNRSIQIIVGGAVFRDKLELATLIDSDSISSDARDVLDTVNALSRSLNIHS